MLILHTHTWMYTYIAVAMVVTVLMVAEKPSICNAIAQALSGGKHDTHGRTPPVHVFRGSFSE